jgi:hypothetical protein
MKGIQNMPPIPLGRVSIEDGIDTLNHLQHEHIEVTRIVDFVWRHVPFGTLRHDAWDAGARAEVTAESRQGDNEQQHMLLAPRPVERIIGVGTGLGHQDRLYSVRHEAGRLLMNLTWPSFASCSLPERPLSLSMRRRTASLPWSIWGALRLASRGGASDESRTSISEDSIYFSAMVIWWSIRAMMCEWSSVL